MVPNAATSESSAGEDRWCSLISLAAGEQLFGTATRVTAWFVLEYDHTFGAEALADSSLPDSVKAYLKAATTAFPGSRVQLVRQPGRAAASGTARAFCVAVPGALYRFVLDDVLDVAELDLHAVASHDPRFEPNRMTETLWLVCVNGKRDRCCARHGAPLYNALRREAGASVWQTSHLGGHRFAPTLVALPDGLMYGRVPSREAGALVREHAARRIALDFYRGCSYDDEPVQAADYYLRRETGILSIDKAPRLLAVRQADGCWRVQFGSAEQSGPCFEVVVQPAPSDFQIARSCADAALAPVTQHHLVELRPLG